MRKKTQLPDSLELLLDTMCNTFGGIMFIAISLIIISQLISKAQLAMTPEEINEKNMKQMQLDIDNFQQKILEIERENLQKQLSQNSSSPEKKLKLKELLKKKEETLKLKTAIELVEIKIKSILALLKRLEEDNDELEKILKDKKADIDAKQELALKLQETLKKEILNLEEELKHIKPKTLRFSHETFTTLIPYWIYLKNDKIYRRGSEANPYENEVEEKDYADGSGGYMIPLKGFSLGINPESKLDYLFDKVDNKRYFINITIDYESFSTFIFLKQYLRNKKFLVNWFVNPRFEYYYSDNVTYKASQ